MNTQTYLPHFTTALNELVDAGRHLLNHNRNYLESAVATTQEKVGEISRHVAFGIALIFLTLICLVIGGLIGSIGAAEKLMTSLSTPLSHADSLLIISSIWLILTVVVGWLAFHVLSTTKNHLESHGRPTVK